MTAVVLFWCAALFVAYTYLGYPLIIALLARLRPLRDCPLLASAQLPHVTVVMAAYNEAARLPAKIANLRALDYPPERVDIVVVSDGSTDATAQVLACQPDVRLLAYPQRQGKAYALNLALKEVRTEFVVFCDVRQDLDPGAVRRLISDFCDPGVGAVSGELVHRASATRAGQHIGLYWRYEKAIRKAESRFHSTVGATGALYAIRTRDFRPLAPDTILDDFEIPMRITRTGKRTLLDPRALVYDQLQTESAAEQKRKIRTLTGNFQTFSRNFWLFDPVQNPVWFQFLSHKVFRLLVPYALVVTLVSSASIAAPLYQAAFAAQLAFYLLAVLGRWVPAARRNRLVSFALVFFDMNAAALVALLRFLSHRADPRWEKT
jgi:cellulose synthase/poly-beta-1,6-N-acetylglucosamine synthase-like glycosyltransferase